MMTGKELFRIWAPVGKKWVDWVRPVPFVMMGECSKIYNMTDSVIQAADYIDAKFKNAAVIVDLPGVESVKEGIALAKSGFRPIPVFNGTICVINSALVNNEKLKVLPSPLSLIATVLR